MPCSCEGYEAYDAAIRANDAAKRAKKDKENKEKIEALQNLADETMQMFCYACGLLREHKIIGFPVEENSKVDKRFISFVNKHDSIDVERTTKSMKPFIEMGVKDPEVLRTIFYSIANQVHPVSNWHKSEYFDSVLEKLGIINRK